MQWQPMSRNAPPPAVSASQKWAACGPEWPSRARIVSTRPSAPEATISCVFMTSGEKTSFSR